jgi:hypothetical protein
MSFAMAPQCRNFGRVPRSFCHAIAKSRHWVSSRATGAVDKEETVIRAALVLADVSVSPTSSGLPAAAFIQQLLNWLGQLALWGSLASILGGAALYGMSQHSGNYTGAYRGKQLAVAGAIGAILTGLAPAVVNVLFNAAHT